MMKTIAVLGVVSAIFAATATPTLARTSHNGPYAYGRSAPVVQCAHGTWDAYSLRCDSAE
jgi:hypothetical protein